jgi:hypothetical protein
MFDLRNTDAVKAHKLRPIGGPWSFFRRMRLLCGGTMVEDIDSYNRTHQMFNQLTAQDSRNNKMVEGFGEEMDIAEAAKKIVNDDGAPAYYNGIRGGQKQTALFKPLSGLFSQNKYIPLKYCGPIIIELEVVTTSTDTVMIPRNDTEATDNPQQYFCTPNTSATWQIENVQVKCDVCTLDNKVENIFTQHMLDGGSFPIRYNNYIAQLQPIAAGTITVMVNVTRTASRLKSCFITLNRKSGSSEIELMNRPWNVFWSPMAGALDVFTYNEDQEIDTFYIQIGSKIYPEYACRSHSEAFYQLTKCLGIQASDIHNLDINVSQYHSHKFIMGIDIEKVLEARGTGYNTKAGDLLTVFFKHKQTSSPANLADEMSTVLVSENILNLSNVGVEVHD